MKSKWFIVKAITYIYNIPGELLEEYYCGVAIKGEYGKVISFNKDSDYAYVKIYQPHLNSVRECAINKKDIDIMSKDGFIVEMI